MIFDETASILIGMNEQLPTNQARATHVERMIASTARAYGSAAAARIRLGLILHLDRARTRA